MSRHRKSPPPRIKNPAYRPALERLDAALKETMRQAGEFVSTARIEALGRVMFGDLWDDGDPASGPAPGLKHPCPSLPSVVTPTSHDP